MKITVAILDKDAALRGLILEKLSYHAKRLKLNVCTKGFSNPEELRASELTFDLLIMNTCQEEPFADGIGWVKQQESSPCYLHLIYVSDEEEKVYEAIGTNPLAFVRKKYLEEDLAGALQRYKDKLDALPAFAVIPEGRKRHILLPEEVLYFSSNGHYVEIHLNDGEKKCIRGKMDDIEKYVASYGFLRIHTSYLINIRYVDYIDRKKVYLKNNILMKPSRKYQDYVCEKLEIYQYERKWK